MSFSLSSRLAKNSLLGLSLTLCTSLSAACASSSSGPFLTNDLSSIGADDSTSGTLSASGVISPNNGSRYTTYAVKLDAGQVLRVKSSANGFSPALTVFAPDYTPLATTLNQANADSQARLITQAPTAGTYLIVLSSQSAGGSGSFSLETSLLAVQDDVEFPGSAAGYLFQGMSAHPISGVPAASYTLTLEEETLLNISARSTEFDTYLSVLDAENSQLLAENDDAAGRAVSASTNSHILSLFPAGTYNILVNSYQGQGQGAFILDVATESAQLSEKFFFGEPYSGIYGLAPAVHGAASRPGFAFPFTVEEDSAVSLQMEASNFDAYLYLLDSTGRVVAEDDDSAGALNPRIVQQLEAGEYTLVASSIAERPSGPYSLITEFITLDDRTSVAPGDSFSSFILPNDSNLPNRPGVGKVYTLEVEETSQLQIDLSSDAFDTYLVLLDENNQLIEENDDNGQTTDSRINRQLTPGTYKVVVTSFGAASVGQFELQLVKSGPSGQSV
ncbi:DVUA0089 family protein [Lujinxingia sediminis]|uniref:DVUA0089 family protein n=1 Tax=Lujinxingia sediminis TaxID=2480984 RepID=UPI0013E31379|nr:DVUA0089 family protein [Lujinxingia sediminis]